MARTGHSTSHRSKMAGVILCSSRRMKMRAPDARRLLHLLQPAGRRRQGRERRELSYCRRNDQQLQYNVTLYLEANTGHRCARLPLCKDGKRAQRYHVETCAKWRLFILLNRTLTALKLDRLRTERFFARNNRSGAVSTLYVFSSSFAVSEEFIFHWHIYRVLRLFSVETISPCWISLFITGIQCNL